MIKLLLVVSLSAFSIVAVCSKLFFLASSRLGVLLMLSNVVYEILYKKLGLQRWPIDAATLVVVTAGWALVAGFSMALIFLVIYSLAWAYALETDLKMRNGSPGVQDRRFQEPAFPNPRLVVLLRGPVWDRGKPYDLGDWPLGHSARFEILILNPTTLRPQFPLIIDLACNWDGIELQKDFNREGKAPFPGGLYKAAFSLRAKALSDEPVELNLSVGVGSYEVKEIVRISSIFDPKRTEIGSVATNRWKGGAQAGFGWRGDMDLYDPTTFQSVEGLRHTLELCRRYRIASTMYLSGRLSLVKSEHEKFCKRLGVDRDTPGIDRFVQFMQEEVTMEAAIDFPYNTGKPYAMEVGNHMYLHYGTHAAMDEGNRWKNRAKIGDGRYPWQVDKSGSFAEQRDNAIHNSRVIEELLGVRVRSWGVPWRMYDECTSRAVEASGMEVGSDTHASKWTNVMRLSPPHHPEGCEHLVELTKKYPGDPDNAYKIAMLKYWLSLARRRRQTFIFMAHHHLLQYKGTACSQLTEEILRHVLEEHRGDFYISTLFGLGQYWERVLCPKHRWVSVANGNRTVINATNKGNEPLDDIPIDVTFKNGKRLLILVSLPAKQTVSIDLDKRVN